MTRVCQCIFFALGLIVALGRLDAAWAATHYSVYCANHKIEVDDRTLEEMKSARGSGVCMFGEFNYLSDAENLANKQFGGAGHPCTCGD